MNAAADLGVGGHRAVEGAGPEAQVELEAETEVNVDRETQRQCALLQALHGLHPSTPPGLQPLPGRAAGGGPSLQAGLAAYRGNARAIAERALAAAYPVVQQLVGPPTFAALAHAFWLAEPPIRGDLAWFGGGFAGWIAGVADLADEAYLADLARLEWAVHRAQYEADHDAPATGLGLLAEAEPETLKVALLPGTAVVTSGHPIVEIWRAHQPQESAGLTAADRFAAVRAAFAEGRQDHALVWRRGWRVEVGCLLGDEAAFTHRLLAGHSLGRALDEAAGECLHFNFEAWLLRALREGWLAGLEIQT